MSWLRTRHPGIQVRHRKGCPAPEGRCRCAKLAPRQGGPSYRSIDPNRRGSYSKVFHDLDALRNWQADQRKAGAPAEQRSTDTFRALWEKWLAGAESGLISTRGKDKAPYTERTLTIYKRNMDRHILPSIINGIAIGDRGAALLTLKDWQDLLNLLRAEQKLSHNSLQTAFNAVRAVYRWACAPVRRILPVNAVHGLEMPAKDEKRRDRVAPPDEARRLLAALAADERCYDYDVLDFAIALYAGQRNVERWGLEWDRHVVFAGGKPKAFHITRDITKSAAGVRTLPVIGLLRPILLREWLRQGKPSSGPVLRPPLGGKPANGYEKQSRRCGKAWADAGLLRITPHSCRHTFASYCIASGLNAKAVTVLMGHSSIEITFDRYGHLFKGHEDEAGERLDGFLGTDDDADEETA